MHVDTSLIELALNEERTMNISTTRLAAAALSLALTLSMLVGIDALATSSAYAPQLAQVAVTGQA